MLRDRLCEENKLTKDDEKEIIMQIIYTFKRGD